MTDEIVFSGFQKLDLLNFPSHIAATVFTYGCNLRCPYCHNPEFAKGLHTETYTQAEVLQYLEKRRQMIEGVVVSGGEPTLQKALPSFIKKVKELGLLTKLDTNGLRPDVLEKLFSDSLTDYVALDIKRPLDGYEILCNSIDSTKQEIEKALVHTLALLGAFKGQWELRTTYLPELLTEADIKKTVEQVFAAVGEKKVPAWYIQAFNPAVTLDKKWSDYSAPSKEDLQNILLIMKNLGVNAIIR